MAYSFERSIVIHAAPEQVYDNLLDVASHKKWGEMTEMDLLYEGPVKVGSRWRSVGVMDKDVMHDECTIVSLERPRLFQFKSVTQHSSMGTAGMIFTYRLKKVPEGTHVIISRGFIPAEMSSKMMRFLLQIGVVRIMDIFMTAPIIDRGLARLRDYVEQAHK